MTALDLLAVAGIVSVPLSIGLGVAWWGARAELRHLRELTRALAERPGRGRGAADARSLEEAVEAVAVDVERLAEGQRFVARLLAERGAPQPPGASRAQPPAPFPPRVVTPH